MTQDISDAVKQMSDIQFPDGLHGRIMRHLVFLKFRTPFLVITALLTANLVVTGWRLWERLAEEQAPLLFSILLENAEWTLVSLTQLARTAFDVAPIPVMVTFALNALALVYVLRLPRRFAQLTVSPSIS